MTAETMGTRGGRGSSPEETNAWAEVGDSPWVSMGESPGPFDDITPSPREPAERPDPFGPDFSKNFAAELLDNKQSAREVRGREIIGNLKEKGQEALSGLREKAKGGLNKLMTRTMKGVYATVGWGAETVTKGRQFAADKEKRSEERKLSGLWLVSSELWIAKSGAQRLMNVDLVERLSVIAWIAETLLADIREEM